MDMINRHVAKPEQHITAVTFTFLKSKQCMLIRLDLPVSRSLIRLRRWEGAVGAVRFSAAPSISSNIKFGTGGYQAMSIAADKQCDESNRVLSHTGSQAFRGVVGHPIY